jgi:CO dehydrogenase/acetyl-CoA synthase gamma subunit (corrinoid Fe-S protein)
MPVNPLEIVRRTPKTNFGQCGFPTGLAFAAAVCKTAFDPTACPFANLADLDLSTACERVGRC